MIGRYGRYGWSDDDARRKSLANTAGTNMSECVRE
jgi:hypothetical protein